MSFLRLFCGLASLGAAATAYSQSLIANGDFESGSLAGWTVVDQTGGSGTFGISTPGSTTPVSSHSTAPNPDGGSYYAVSDQTGGGAHALIQTFTIGSTAESVMLNFQLFVNNWAMEETVNPAGLDYTAGPNEFASVDILSGSADALDTGAGVLVNLYLGAEPATLASGFASYSFDITSVVSTPGMYQLRFAEADNEGYFNMGVDNVSITLGTGSVPEPTTLALVGFGALGYILFRRRK